MIDIRATRALAVAIATVLAASVVSGAAPAPPAPPRVATPAPPQDLADSLRLLAQLATTRGSQTDSARLARFSDLYWTASLRQSPELSTYGGYPGLNDRWSDRSDEGLALGRRLAREELAALAAIDRSHLGTAEQVTYDLARRGLDLRIEGERFHDEALLVGPMDGIDLDLLQVLEAMPTRTRGDFEDRLRRLRGWPRVVDQVLAQLDKGLAAGITPPRITLHDVPERVRGLLAADPWQSPVLKTFQKLPETIPAAEQQRLRGEAARVFTEQVAPALRKLHDYLAETYVPRARASIAMSDLPDGRAWYVHELRANTTTDLSPEQIHDLGLAEVRRIRGEMDELIASTGFAGGFADFCRFLRTDPRFFYDRPEDLVAAYRDITKRIDPELVRLFGRLPRLPYGVKAMEGPGTRSAPSAYYTNGSLAAGQPGWFLVNTYDLRSRPKWEMEALALHESVPGHHLQWALAEEIEGLPEWRRWDVYPAFAEGWGLYAESLGSELGLYQDPYSRFGQLANEVWRAIRLVVDTGLHAQGWTRQQAVDYCRANSPRPDHDIEVEIDRYISQPGTAPVYKLGALELQKLRRYAQQELGARFDIRAFHEQVLGHGQLPLDVLDKSIRTWVAQTKAGQAKGAGAPVAWPSST
jgi:uncharacterized protein (DUF885 family)